MGGLGTTVLVAGSAPNCQGKNQWIPARVAPLRRCSSHPQPQQSAWASSKESSEGLAMQHHIALHLSAPDREMLCGTQLPLQRLRSLHQTGPGRVSHPRGSAHSDKGMAHPPSPAETRGMHTLINPVQWKSSLGAGEVHKARPRLRQSWALLQVASGSWGYTGQVPYPL